MLETVKLALGVTGTDWDTMIQDLIDAAMLDLGIAGVEGTNVLDSNPLIRRAVVTYCRLHFSMFGLPDGYDRLKESYDEQKAQLGMATGYTNYE